MKSPIKEKTLSSLATLLKQSKESILEIWETYAKEQIPAARAYSRAAFRDHLPDFLDELIEALGSPGENPTIKITKSTTEPAKNHGRQRIRLETYNLDQVLCEFRLFRRAIFEVIEKKRKLTARERDLVLEAIELGVAETAKEFVKIQFSREQQAKAQMQAVARRLEGLQAITDAALVSSVSLYNLLNDLVERIRELFSADAVVILILSTNEKELVVRATYGLDEDSVQRLKIPIGKGVAGQVFLNNKATIINDLSKAEVVSTILKKRVKSLMAVPLKLVGKPIGVIHLGSSRKRIFTQEDLTFFELIADRIAVAIDRANLIDQERATQKRLQLINESIPQITWTATGDGKAEHYNKNWYDYTGLTPNSDPQDWSNIIHPDDIDRTSDAWKAAQESGRFQIEHRFLGKDAKYRWFLTRAIAVYDGDGQYVEWFGTSTEIEQQKKHQQELEHERELREQFVNTLSHDLRNPLCAAKISAQLLARASQNPEKIISLSVRISENLNRTDKMIQNLLDANRIRAGKTLPLEITEANLSRTVQEVCEEFSTIHGNRIRLDCPEDVIGHWSQKDLQRVIENLVSNALKYGSPGGTIHVRLKANEKEVTLSVHNHGNPIPSENIPKLFSQFSQMETSGQKGKTGWGLGLTLVKGVAEAHRGRVSVKSSAEEGTEFTIHLPWDSRSQRR